VVGPSAAENTRGLQTKLLKRAEEWARESGAVFEAEKTAFIHFIRPLQPDRESTNHMVFGNKTIAPKKSVKISGVTLDSGLSMNEHVSKAVSKKIGRCMALRRPTSADAPDVCRSRSAHDRLRGINVVCTVAHRGQKACSGA
jgi:hypothetical protein